MRKSVTFRLDNKVHSDIEAMATERGITFSQVLCELIEVGLKVKKHMENKKSNKQLSINLVEKGAASAIETLTLVRRFISETHPDWITEAHEEAKVKVKKFREQD